MNPVPRYSSNVLSSRRLSTNLSHTLYGWTPYGRRPVRSIRPAYPSGYLALSQCSGNPRLFSTTSKWSLKEYFEPPKDAPHIRTTEPAWKHPIYSEQAMRSIHVAHREPKDFSDRVALFMMRLLRWGMNTATGYQHGKEVVSATLDPKMSKENKRYTMNERKWLIRMVFLESVAGVPGMVAGMLRHLHSLRRMKRDNGWIETLLEEAYNERMHLLTFLKMAEPGWFMRFIILGAQGVFFNSMFISYLISPRTCHRFVGYLEEEAVHTYSVCLEDIESGKLPRWQSLQAPDIAIRYWNMPEGHRTIKDLLLYVRADEAKHREVNHTLGNLSQNSDPNPFVSKYIDDKQPHPDKGIENIRSLGWERKEVI
ncbi:MAG: hypothetical protein M1816_007795 [Peltula sp. TS41687]|nr:MAG: hypothetical protein M1816_007795 [Peltula sp. TS41687]